MLRFWLSVFGVLVWAFPAAATEIHPGVPLRFTIAPRSEAEVLSAVQLTVEPGTQRVAIEVVTDNPAHDLDLYLRTGREVEVNNLGEIIADHSSTTTGSGLETIELAGSTQNPVQSGVYFIALHVLTLNTQITGTLRVTADVGAPASTFLISRFEFMNDDGWRPNFPATGVPGEFVSDFASNLSVFPPGFLRVQSDGTASQHFVVAPKKFLGNLEVFENGRFEFDFRHVNSQIAPQARIDLHILGAGSVFRRLGPIPPPGEWIHVEARFDDDWTRIFGDASFPDALSNVDRIEVSMDHAFGPETADLDNFAFLGDPRLDPILPSGGPASSDFESGLDGWSRNYPPVAIGGARTGSPRAALVTDSPGADSDRFLKLIDEDGLNNDCIVAPPKYIGDLSGLNLPWIEFDYRRIEGPAPMNPARARLIGSGGGVYVGTFGRPRNEWRRTRIPFIEKYWLADPDFPSQPFDQVLANVRRLEICLDLSPGPEIVGVDNFHLRTDFTPTTGRAIEVAPATVTFTATEGGPATPPQQIRVTATGGDVDWDASVEPASAEWLRLSPLSGETPSTLELSADPAGLPVGVHTAVVRIEPVEFGVADVTVEVTFIVEGGAGVPILNPGGISHAAFPGLPLSGGVLATAFGRNLASEAALVPAEGDMLPTSYRGVEVLVLDLEGNLIAACPLIYLDSRQINFQLPIEVLGLAQVRIVISVNGIRSRAETVSLQPTGPGIFLFGGDRAAALNQDGSLNTAANPAPRNTVVQVFLSGIGEVSPAVPTGKLAPESPLSFATALASATLGGEPVRIVSLTLAPGFAGVGQANIEVNGSIEPGDHALILTAGDVSSNSAVLSVE